VAAREAPERSALDAIIGPDALASHLKVLSNARRLRLLEFLVRPRTVEEMASKLAIARQNAQEHLQQLLAIGVVQRLPDRGERGVARYVVVPAQLFTVQEAFVRLGTLQPEAEAPGRRPTYHLATSSSAPAEEDLPRLVLVRGMRLGQTTVLAGPGPWMLGREPAAAVALDYDPFVSVRHTEVRRAAGGFEAADLYSSNGTFVDWRRLPRGGARALANGSLLGVGRTILLFRRPA
jgi:DNA-binding transcriptional ArsR family regulator